MEKLLNPACLDLDPNSPTAAREWKHWLCTFIEECGDNTPTKFRTLKNSVSRKVFDYRMLRSVRSLTLQSKHFRICM